MAKKKIVDAKADSDGDITHVKFDGNKRFTSVETAIPMAERGASLRGAPRLRQSEWNRY